MSFLSDFKLGHYMKIPPRSMFFVQVMQTFSTLECKLYLFEWVYGTLLVVWSWHLWHLPIHSYLFDISQILVPWFPWLIQLSGTFVSTSIYYGTAWWLLTTVENICRPDKLPEGSPWTCPGDDVFYNASIIWGVVGPLRMFADLGLYSKMNWFFLIGMLLPVLVWGLSRMFPKAKWITLINFPIILGATGSMPPARAVNYLCWGAVGFIFNFVVYRRFKHWWARHNYILSAGLDAGVAFMAVLTFFTLQFKNIFGVTWWGLELDDHCPLAHCPTAPGIVVKGCPVF